MFHSLELVAKEEAGRTFPRELDQIRSIARLIKKKKKNHAPLYVGTTYLSTSSSY